MGKVSVYHLAFAHILIKDVKKAKKDKKLTKKVLTKGNKGDIIDRLTRRGERNGSEKS